MSSRIAVVGTGYVGLVTAVGLADFGNRVVGVDIDAGIVASLQAGMPTIYEHALNDYLQRNVESGRLSFTTGLEEAIASSDVIFITVGTPPSSDGSADLSQVGSVIDSLVKSARSHKTVVIKSTVPIGTNRRISSMLEEHIFRGCPNASFTMVANPEFLREGRAIHDFFHPDRVVIGTEDGQENAIMAEIYRPLNLISTPFVWCNWETAELSKYASNAFLATKITFINQVANLSDECGADAHVVARIMGMDGRIGPKFLHPGPGFGGSCFPKDTMEMARTGKRYGIEMTLTEAVIAANERQKEIVTEKLLRLTGALEGKIVAVLGTTFKAETDDVRASPALAVVPALLRAGANVRIHDPKGIRGFEEEIRKLLSEDIVTSRISLHFEVFEAISGANVILILTEWNEYRNLDLARIRRSVREPYLLDARNVLDAGYARRLGFKYSGIGRL